MKYSEFLKTERPCPFCKPDPKEIIAENETAYLTFALAPYHADHLLVVPKRHIEHILDITNEELLGVDALQDKGWGLLQHLGYKSVSYVLREGDNSGRTLTHMHYHLIPDVRIGDIDHNGDERKILSPEEIPQLVSKWKNAL